MYQIELDYWVEAYGSPYEVEPTEAFMLDMITRGFSPQDAAAEWVSQILDSLQLELSSKIISPKKS